nr:hypothetical protein Itr_chr02CG03890 [Ipomoea trifida]GMC56861.1 hypothetical protein Iba_chr02aCG0450 [Ipomoea batatas]
MATSGGAKFVSRTLSTPLEIRSYCQFRFISRRHLMPYVPRNSGLAFAILFLSQQTLNFDDNNNAINQIGCTVMLGTYAS